LNAPVIVMFSLSGDDTPSPGPNDATRDRIGACSRISSTVGMAKRNSIHVLAPRAVSWGVLSTNRLRGGAL